MDNVSFIAKYVGFEGPLFIGVLVMAFCFKNVEGWSENVLWHLSSNNDHTWNKTLNDGSHGFILESTWNKNRDKNKELIFYSFSPL